MKVLLYFEKQNVIKQSGIGRALVHQKKALESAGIEYTLNPNDDYDIAHINTLFSDSYRVLKKCKKKGIPVVVHGHSTVEDFRNSFRLWKIAKIPFYHYMFKMYRNADYIITPTPYSKGLIESYDEVNCKVYDISNGIDLTDYSYNQDAVNKFKEHFNIKTKHVIIGIGLFFERKGIIDFFECAKSFPDVTFIWFGHLNKIITQIKINKAIRHRPKNVIMPGYISGEIIKGAFHSADLLFFPSYEETEGIVVLEALASKLPVLVRDIKVYKPWLKDNVSCYMGKDNPDFINKIKYILNNDNSKVVENGYEVVKERSINNVGQKLKDVYLEIAQKKDSN